MNSFQNGGYIYYECKFDNNYVVGIKYGSYEQYVNFLGVFKKDDVKKNNLENSVYLVDVSLKYNGWYTDCAPETKDLMRQLAYFYTPDSKDYLKIGNGCLEEGSVDFVYDSRFWHNDLQKYGIDYIGSKDVKNLVIPKGSGRIKSNEFKDFSDLKSVRLHRGIYEIGENAFENCKALKNINLNGSHMYVCKKAFANCCSIEHIDIDDMICIGDSAFENCSSSKEINVKAYQYTHDIPKGYPCDYYGKPFIGKDAFKGCNSLEKLTFNGVDITDKIDEINAGKFKEIMIEKSASNDVIRKMMSLWGDYDADDVNKDIQKQ